MRAGICNIQLQALTPEAATIVKQAVNLATRRGHAQVTPLHVASAMLATSTGLLRRACLQCHSHPLQSKALELCFNVALNRLPASTGSPLLGPHYSIPSLSNALVAAFKRAQAHQRRGSIENQQQPILALKIEVEQLIISILDDPSVSRVMREAGFSSTLVKTRVEQAVSVEVSSQRPPSRSQSNKEITSKPQALNGGAVSPSSSPFGHYGVSLMNPFDHIKNTDDDVTSVLSEILNKRRNTVILGENLASAEGVARGVMERFERGNVPGDLKYMQFVSLPHGSFRSISREEVKQKLVEIRCLVKSCVGRGVVLYLGDLKWLFDFWSNYCEKRTSNYYSAVEHLVMELKKLVSGSGESSRMWLMGIATFTTYMKCKTCHPSLEALWDLHPFTIPAGCSLSLSLNFDSDFPAQERSTAIRDDGFFSEQARVNKHLTCCRDCSVNFDKEARYIASRISKKECISSGSTLPIWLQNCKEEIRSCTINDQENASLKDLCKKWNSFCSSVHRHSSIILEKPFKFASPSSSPCASVSSHEFKPNTHQNHLKNWPLISEPKELPRECELYIETGDDCCESNLIMFMPDRNVPKPDLLSNPNSSPNSASSSEAVEGLESTDMFKELNPENLKILIDALESKVPQRKDIVHEISSTVLRCRSGMRKNCENSFVEKQETWMFFLGSDSQAKEKVSRELAKVVFGSYNNYVTIGLSSFASSPRVDSNEESKGKRARIEKGSTYLQRFGEEMNENPHRVFFMEDLDQVDYFSQKGIKKAIESGSLTLSGGESVPLKDAIIIFSCENFSSVSRACSSPRASQSAGNEEKEKQDNLEEKNLCLSLDLNIPIEDDARDLILAGESGILELVDKKIHFEVQEL